jgi:psiF repeat
MKACNTQAADQKLSSDARKSFMTDCLSGKTAAAAPAPMTQQDKMKACNVQASSQKLNGDARKSFMSTCLRG